MAGSPAPLNPLPTRVETLTLNYNASRCTAEVSVTRDITIPEVVSGSMESSVSRDTSKEVVKFDLTFGGVIRSILGGVLDEQLARSGPVIRDPCH